MYLLIPLFAPWCLIQASVLSRKSFIKVLSRTDGYIISLKIGSSKFNPSGASQSIHL